MREFYGYALVAGISVAEARRMTPGFVRDMYVIRVRYDAQVMGGRVRRKTGL